MMRLAQVALVACCLSTLAVGCKTSCEELAEKVCDRSGEDVSACDSLPEGADEAKRSRCDKMKTFAATCKTLRLEAQEATADDEAACKADLELIRALERAQM